MRARSLVNALVAAGSVRLDQRTTCTPHELAGDLPWCRVVGAEAAK
jgi:hypothetical protein